MARLDQEQAVSDLRCGCIEGFLTNEEHHESWCSAVTGDYGTLPVLENPCKDLATDDDLLTWGSRADTIQQQPDKEES